MNGFNITFCSDDALRVQVADRETRLARTLQLQVSRDWSEVVPGRSDITVQFDPHTLSPADAKANLSRQLAASASFLPVMSRTVELPARFGGKDGPDLVQISDRMNLPENEVISRLLSAPLQVDMLGFTPGFAYLSGLDENIEIPRLNQPRQQVPAGSIGLITGQCGLYALDGPGGWPIIGRAQAPLFDAAAENPFLLQSGMRVQLIDVA